jgi:hypothetical protein
MKPTVTDLRRLSYGDVVNFKSDFEQMGRIKGFADGGLVVVLESLDEEGFDGAYSKGLRHISQPIGKVWI